MIQSRQQRPVWIWCTSGPNPWGWGCRVCRKKGLLSFGYGLETLAKAYDRAVVHLKNSHTKEME